MRTSYRHLFLYTALLVGGHLLAYKMVQVPTRIEIVVFLAVGLLFPILRNPLVGVYAVFLLLPFISFFRRLFYLAYSRPQRDPLLMTGEVLLAVILMALFFEFRERGRSSRSTQRFHTVVLVYFIYLLVRVFVYNFLPLTEAVARFKFYGPAVLFFFIGTFYADRIRSLKTIWILTLVTGIAAALYGFKQLALGYSAAEKAWIATIDFSTLMIEDIIRPFSFFKAPVAFADYLQLTIIAALMCAGWAGRRIWFISLPAIVVAFYGVLITSVRSSWIGVMVTVPLWFLFVGIRGTTRRIVVLCLLAAVYIVTDFMTGAGSMGLQPQKMFGAVGKGVIDKQYLDLLVTERSTAIASPFEEHSFLARLATWRYLYYSLIDPVKAIMGRGLGALKADSLYFTYLAEFGIPGLMFIVLLLFFLVREGLYVVDHAQNRELVILARGVTTMNLVFALVSITGSHIHYFPGDIYFWFFNGVIVYHGGLLKETTGSDRDHLTAAEADENTGDT